MEEPKNPYEHLEEPQYTYAEFQAPDKKSSTSKEEPSRGCQIGCLLLIAAIFAFIFFVILAPY